MSTYAMACNIFIIVAWTALVSWWWVHNCLREYRWIRDWAKGDGMRSVHGGRLDRQLGRHPWHWTAVKP